MFLSSVLLLAAIVLILLSTVWKSPINNIVIPAGWCVWTAINISVIDSDKHNIIYIIIWVLLVVWMLAFVVNLLQYYYENKKNTKD